MRVTIIWGVFLSSIYFRKYKGPRGNRVVASGYRLLMPISATRVQHKLDNAEENQEI